MSVEIKGFEGGDRRITGDIAHEAARLCVAQGMSAAEAFTSGSRGGQYAAELTITVLREMGLIPNQDFDVEEFLGIAHRITDESINPR